MPTISIIIPVYNGMNYIRESVQSVLGQSYSDWELLIVDDGSKDALVEYIESIQDPRVFYLPQPRNMGAPAALNRGILESSGKYICWLSHDDIFMPDKLKTQINFMNSHNEFGITYTDFYKIDADGATIETFLSPHYPKSKFPNKIIEEGNFINGSSVMIRRECFNKAGLFDTKMKYVADGEMWARMMKYYDFGHVPGLLIKYRVHPMNQSHNIAAMYYYKKRSLLRMLECLPLQRLIPEKMNSKEGCYLLASIFYKRWKQPGLAAKMYMRALNQHNFSQILWGLLCSYLYLYPRMHLSMLKHFTIRHLQKFMKRKKENI
ncbi:glycosyltransferase [Chlamydiota bacterium]